MADDHEPQRHVAAQAGLFQAGAPALVDLQDRFQSVQVDLAFDLEIAVYYTGKQWCRATHVLDLGCGAGLYMRRLSERFPDKDYEGIDHNGALIDLALSRHGSDRRRFRKLDYQSLTSRFDFVIARLLVQYLPDQQAFLSTVSSLVRPGGSLVIIDADDSARLFFPPIPRFIAFFENYRAYQRAIGLDRDRVLGLPSCAVSQNQWTVGLHDRIFIPSTLDDYLDRFFAAYLLMLDLVQASNLFPCDIDAIRTELAWWRTRPDAYTQIGLVALRLDRNLD
jgi:SAM-dependent methyltransferase